MMILRLMRTEPSSDHGNVNFQGHYYSDMDSDDVVDGAVSGRVGAGNLGPLA